MIYGSKPKISISSLQSALLREDDGGASFPGKRDQRAEYGSRLWADGGILWQEWARLNITNEEQRWHTHTRTHTHTHTHTHTRTYGTWIILAIDQLGCESSVMLSVTRRLSVCNNITPRFPRRSLRSQLLCLLLNGKSLRWNIHPHTLLSLGAQESQLRSH